MVLKLRTVLLTAISIVAFSLQAQEVEEKENELHHCFFNNNSITIGSGALYSFANEITGVNLKAYYNWNDYWCVGPEIALLSEGDKTIKEISLVAHYIFETKHFGVFPLMGVKYTDEVELTESSFGYGIIYGVGIHRNFGRLGLFTELSGVQGQVDDYYFNAGVMFNFDI